MARAVLEGVSFGLRDSLELIRALGVPIDQIRAFGRRRAAAPLWRQILADVFNTELVTVNATEGAAYGVALIATVGAGIFASVTEAVESTVEVINRTAPNAEDAAVYESLYPVYRGLHPR